ncbi:DoxX-like family protein [Bradymonas sediminis]|uniref:Uncharacterized protein n=1 Tax=Bradymonas sediminis TaxID=1548548 RepID=A0A2Z4FNL9_9DELT|nr:DoxX-like family protein [Bradymonas sediminis]AWV90288.1 hypothetical protein DN745_13485 [Bradymonas sediminis]TDP75743.1 DoxX-like protein [Bradymonas sediminis]
MNQRTRQLLRTGLAVVIAGVWVANGLWAKILGNVPRHEAIVARVLGAEVAPWLILLIGVGEVFIAAWVLSRFRPRVCAAVQIALVLSMNVLEFIFARDVLLFGGLNFVFALGFCALVAFHGSLSHRVTQGPL